MGANRKMKNAFMAPNCEAVSSKPRMFRSITRSAYRVMEAALCSNSAQNTTVDMVRTINTIIRWRSTRLHFVAINHPRPSTTASAMMLSSEPTAP